MSSEFRTQNFDLAKFPKIIPRNACYGAFFSWNLASELKKKKSKSPAKLNLG